MYCFAETTNSVLIQAKLEKMEEENKTVEAAGKKGKEAAAKKHLVLLILLISLPYTHIDY